jgi:hypothetical protein
MPAGAPTQIQMASDIPDETIAIVIWPQIKIPCATKSGGSRTGLAFRQCWLLISPARSKASVALGTLRFAGRFAQRLAVTVVAGVYAAVRHCPCLCDEGSLIWAAADRGSAYQSSVSVRHAEHHHANGGKRNQPSKLHCLCLLQTIGTRYCAYVWATKIKSQRGEAPFFLALGYLA